MLAPTMPAPDGTAYDLHGPRDAPAVVLIHGLGLARGLWDPMIAAYADRFRVVAYDLYGHGESAPAPAEPSLALFRRQVAGLLDHLGLPRAALVGFSIGGMINRRVALDHPGRVSALAILNSPHDRGEEAQALVEARAATVREEGAMATMEAALLRWFTPAFRAAHPEALAQVRAWREGVDAESYAGTARVLAEGVRELIAPDPPVAVPALVLTAEHDTGSPPAMTRAIAAEIAGAESLIVPHYQHLGLMEDPAAFTDPVIRFLERTLA
jgi:3-oxoadipate enol-lactonase